MTSQQTEFILTKEAPAPIGPYNQATALGNLVFVSGQIALDPQLGQMIQSNIQAETTQVLANLEAVLLASGSHKSKLLKVTIFLATMDDFSAVNEVYGQFLLGCPFPARETVAVSGLPKGAHVEISAIAWR